ncbi:hypothetical protein BLNAU_9127 [Blattamonas nauphoetae]|uniref:Uncharacterized protein n=1 Tax=Blattamonas nauphoetae TaxID=2049346 RepID=A0ABQ9XWU8_9EUKA|nr:hypothetical protein BLNAU_9127 [Blattamonas nauphoetae]
MLSLVTVLTTVLWSRAFPLIQESYSTHTRLDSILGVDTRQNHRSSSKRLSEEQVVLEPGIFTGLNIQIQSRHVEVTGVLSSVLQTESPSQPPTFNGAQQDGLSLSSIQPMIFDVFNSSVLLNGVTLALFPDSRISRVDSSIFQLAQCCIVSGIEICPIAIISRSSQSTSSLVVISRSTYSSTQLSFLVPLVENLGCSHSTPATWDNVQMNDEFPPSLDHSIVGISMNISSSTFLGRTGPLFGQNCEISTLKSPQNPTQITVRTSLLSASFTNTTSQMTLSTPHPPLRLPNLEQKIISCSVCTSTNIFAGTVIHDINRGSLLCSNSSFSQCSSASPGDYGAGNRFVYESDTTASALIFTNCTFLTMSYSNSTTNLGGAAIAVFNSTADLAITECSFHDCNCSGDGIDGGAVNSRGDPKLPERHPSHTTVSKCSFTSCYAEDAGGAALQDLPTTFSLTNSSFANNCASHGGSLFIIAQISFSLSTLLFRDNIATNKLGSDIYFHGYSSTDVPLTNISSCDTTALTASVYFPVDDKSTTTHVPQVKRGLCIHSTKVTHDQDTATVTVTTATPVKGTMSVVLAGGRVPRLVFVTFEDNSGAGSTVGTATVPSYILPSGKTYSVVCQVLTKYQPRDQFIWRATSQLQDSNTSKVEVRGVGLGMGSYVMTVKDSKGNQVVVNLNYVDSTTLTATETLYPATSDQLAYETEYTISSVTCGSTNIFVNDDVVLSVPKEPARILSTQSTELNGQRNEVTVSFAGSLLTRGAGIAIAGRDGVSIESSGVITIDNSTSCSAVFKTAWTESATALAFGEEYMLRSIGTGTTAIAINDGITFRVPLPPVITSFSAPAECSSLTFDVSVGGQNLPIGETYTVQLTDQLSFSLTFSSADTGAGTVSAGLPSQVLFNHSYSIESVRKGAEFILLNSTTLRTPVGPTLKDVRASLNMSNINNVIVSLESLRMPVGEMTLTVQEGSSTPIALTVSFVSSEAGSVEVVVFGGSTLKYGTSYSVVSLTSSSLHCSLDKPITFSTPATPARIKTASCSLVGELKRSGEVVLSGEALLAGTLFSISLDEIDENGDMIVDTTPITLSDKFGGEIGDTALTTHTLSISLFPVPQLMKYSGRYRITSLTISSAPTIPTAVENTATFKVPAEPARIVGIWGNLDASGNTTSITLCGRQIATGSYTVRINSENGPWFDISFSDGMSDERNSSVASVPILGDSPVLSFGVTYTLFSVTPTSSPSTSLLIDASPNSFTISEPARITGIEIGSLSDALKTEASLSLTGRALQPNTDYTISLSGHPKSPSSMGANAEPDKRTITIRSDFSNPSGTGSKTIKLYPHDSAELLFGYEYSVDSVCLDGLTLLQNSGLSFSTPSEPARLSLMKSYSLTASKDGVIVVVEGFALKEDTTLIIVTSSDGRVIESDGKIEVKTSSECWIRFKVSWAENTTHLEFLKTYTLTAVRSGSNELIITPELFFTVPSGPIVKSITAPLDCSSSSFSVQIVGTDLPIESGFRVELDGGLWFLVDFDSSTTGNGTISASLPGQMQFDTSYSVVSVTKGDRKMKCESVSFKTPVGPTLVDVKAALNASNINNVIVTLESLRMPVGEMTLTVQEGSSTPIALTVSFVSSEAGSVEVVVFGGSTLKYGTSYTVMSLTSSSLHCSLDKPITFSTPATPARIKTASCSLVGESERSGEVVLHGEALPAGTSFSISLDEIDEK